MKKKGIQWITILLFSTGILILTACGSSNQSGSEFAATDSKPSGSEYAATDNRTSGSEHRITVNSSEKVTVVPDLARVVYAVRTENKEAAACQQENSKNVSSVIELLKSLGVAESSIQTSDYSMYPIYNYSGNTQKITGYEATTTLTVSDLPINNLGEMLAQSVSTGINNVQSVSYSSSQYDEGYQEALKLAVASAREKAEALAEASGSTLGAVINIVENSNYSEARYTDYALASSMSAAGVMAKEQAADTGNIMPGEVDIEVNITVSFAL